MMRSENWFAVMVMVAVGLTFSAGAISAGSQPSSESVVGIWQGTLVVPGASLRVVFKISENPDGTLEATLDSPDQGATDIPVNQIEIRGDSLLIDVAVVSGSFRGKVVSDSTITGTWYQSGAALPLELNRIEIAPEIERPQEPKPPYPYREEEVSFVNEKDGITLAGTLTLPDTAAPYPVVVLISGSGPQDRNETVFGHRPFLILADCLTRKGIAVLRFDDRGVGGSTGDFSSATTEDFVDDALAAVDYLKQRKDIDASKIGLIGHSEGALVAPMAAVRSKDIAFIVLLAAPAITGKDLLHIQAELIARTDGVSEETIEKSLGVQDSVLVLATRFEDAEEAREKIRRLLEDALAQMTEEEKSAIGLNADLIDKQLDEVLSPWFRFFLSYDPRPTLSKVTCPVLALYGQKDLQVPPLQNAVELEEALVAAGNDDVTVKILPGLNHLFQTCETGSPREYGTIEETVSPTALETISSWILEHIGK